MLPGFYHFILATAAEPAPIFSGASQFTPQTCGASRDSEDCNLSFLLPACHLDLAAYLESKYVVRNVTGYINTMADRFKNVG